MRSLDEDFLGNLLDHIDLFSSLDFLYDLFDLISNNWSISVFDYFYYVDLRHSDFNRHFLFDINHLFLVDHLRNSHFNLKNLLFFNDVRYLYLNLFELLSSFVNVDWFLYHSLHLNVLSIFGLY